MNNNINISEILYKHTSLCKKKSNVRPCCDKEKLLVLYVNSKNNKILTIQIINSNKNQVNKDNLFFIEVKTSNNENATANLAMLEIINEKNDSLITKPSINIS
jgi:hypothetical protein